MRLTYLFENEFGTCENHSIEISNDSIMKECVLELLDVDDEYLEEEYEGDIVELLMNEISLNEFDEPSIYITLENGGMFNIEELINEEDEELKERFELTVQEFIK